MGDERDQDVQRAPLWPPEPEPSGSDAQPQTPPQTPPQNPWSAEPWGQWGAPAPEQFVPPASSAQPQYPPEPEQPRNPWQAAAIPWEERPPMPSVEDEPTMRVSAAPAPSISDAQTMRVSAAPAPSAPATPEAPGQPRQTDGGFAPAPRLEAADAPTQRYTAPPPVASPTAPTSPVASETTTASAASAITSAPPASTPASTPPSEPPGAPRKRLSRAWRLGLTLAVSALLLAGAGGLYAYASQLAAQPQKVLASYCAAIKRDDYRAAYALLASSAQAQESEAQYLADASARDTIEGPVSQCSGSPTQALSPLSFLRAPRSIIFNAQITRKNAASGQIALTRDEVGWHVAALSSTLQGVDLGPLATEQALCKAFGQHAYDQAYTLLSTPYQKEQGDAATFARAFGSSLTVSGCAPDLKTYSVNSADQQASMNATLTVSIAAGNGAGPANFSLPAKLMFVREATGWRVDAITPLLNQ
ncbi:MAG TPA: hypothetical protein VFN78_06600 [Ktedonobacterales bacterium]|nr:hypothetical protein [Ktedonobacterales bacterium]